MSLRTIMIPVERNRTNAAQLRAALGVAADYGARAIGIMACEHLPTLYYEAGALDYDPIEEDRRRLADLMQKEGQRFLDVAADVHVEATWRTAIEWPTEFVRCEARAADLIVSFLGIRDNACDLEIGPLVMKAGRPLLLLSEAGLPLPAKVLVTWKDTRESRRAVRDALPILARAAVVHVLEVAEGEEDPKRAERRVADVADWLRSHDVEASFAATALKGRVEDRIEEAARTIGADLIVAGAYGHTRLGEWIFGGVTRYLLRQGDRSILLSH